MNPKKIENLKNEKIKKIKEISQILKNGGVAIFPTDTVYGIGSLPIKNVVERIYKIKNRDFSKKIIALISKKEQLTDLIDENEEEIKKIYNIMDKYWPGELTIIFKANKEFTKKFDEKLDTIGIRIPKNSIALEIIENTGGILLTTSANLSGENAVIKIEDINKDVVEKVDYIFEDKNLKLTGIPSTIIKYTNGKLELIREGSITFNEILLLMK